MLLTRRVDFSASHVCAILNQPEEVNQAIYGEAARDHGHNYVLEVTLEGEPDPVTGMVYDLRRLKQILNQEVVEPMDHRSLNREVPAFARVVPTVENLAIEIWRRLRPHFDGVTRLYSLRLYETEDLFVDYQGEGV